MVRLLLPLLLVVLAPPGRATECRPVENLAAVLEPGRVLLLGELHGTAESPAFVLDVACHAAAAGLPVVVGLEQPKIHQALVDRFLDSDGTSAERERLLAGRFWQAGYQDGRASQAMFALIAGIRSLRAAGAAARIVLFDSGTAGGNQARDRAMGQAVAAMALAAPDALTIALTGNMHSRRTKGRPRNAEYEPLGWIVAQRVPAERLVALDVGHGPGSAWICAPECGIQQIGARHDEGRWAVEIDDTTRPAGHDGWYFVGDFTASLPARMGVNAEPLQSSVDESTPASPTPEAVAPAVAPAVADAAPESPLSPAETKLQGAWQAHDYESDSTTWKMDFDGRRFRADGGADDWYEGRIAIRTDTSPAWIDFTIEDCRCDFKNTTSTGIFSWEDDTVVIAAPSPGNRRPSTFVPSRGEMLRLKRRAPPGAAAVPEN